MALFDFKCSKCNNTFEVLVRSTTKEIKCSKCGSTSVIKLISKFSHKFNCGGFEQGYSSNKG